MGLILARAKPAPLGLVSITVRGPHSRRRKNRRRPAKNTKGGQMQTEEKAERAAEAIRRAVVNPLIPAGARAALIALADSVSCLAHEVEILKMRLSKGGE